MPQLKDDQKYGVIKVQSYRVSREKHRWSSHPADLNASDAVLSSEFTSIFEPPNAWHGAAHGWTPELHGVACRNSVQLLLHTLRVSPVRTCMDDHGFVKDPEMVFNIKNIYI